MGQGERRRLIPPHAKHRRVSRLSRLGSLSPDSGAVIGSRLHFPFVLPTPCSLPSSCTTPATVWPVNSRSADLWAAGEFNVDFNGSLLDWMGVEGFSAGDDDERSKWLNLGLREVFEVVFEASFELVFELRFELRFELAVEFSWARLGRKVCLVNY